MPLKVRSRVAKTAFHFWWASGMVSPCQGGQVKRLRSTSVPSGGGGGRVGDGAQHDHDHVGAQSEFVDEFGQAVDLYL